MANPQTDDPFLEVQADVQTVLSQTRHLFSSYLRIRTLSKSTNSPECQQSRSELQNNIETLTNDLQDLRDSIAAVETDPYSFGLDITEVSRRRQFVKDVGNEVESMREQVGDVSGISHVADEIGKSGGRDESHGKSKLPNPAAFEDDDSENEDHYAAFEHQQQQVMMREQDEQLDGVYRSVGVLRNQAEDMGRELEEQGQILDDVDKLADRVGGKLAVGMKKVKEVARKNEDWASSCCIGVLIIVLILLLIFAIVL